MKNQNNTLPARVEALDNWLKSHNKKVVVHNGIFHADDVLSVAVLRNLGRDGKDLKFEVIRTRDVKKYEGDSSALIIDVGGGIFDHHGKEAMERNGCFSFQHCEGDDDVYCPPHCGLSLLMETINWSLRAVCFDALDEVVCVTAFIDNGKELPEGFENEFAFVNNFNPSWNEESDFDSKFMEVVDICTAIIRRKIQKERAEFEALKVLDGLRLDEIMELPKAGIPWQNYIPKRSEKPKFVIYLGEDGKTYYLQCVPEVGDRFSKRIPHPKSWAEGKDVPSGNVFVHAGRFISGWKTREDALHAAELAIKLHKEGD